MAASGSRGGVRKADRQTDEPTKLATQRNRKPFLNQPKDVATCGRNVVVWAGSNVKHIIFVFMYNKYKYIMRF